MSELSSSELREENEKLSEENARLTRMLRVTEKFRTMLISVVNHCKCDVETNIRLRFNLLMQEYYESRAANSESRSDSVSNEEMSDESDADDDNEELSTKTDDNSVTASGQELSQINITSNDNVLEDKVMLTENELTVKDSRLINRTVINSKSKVDSKDLRDRIAKLRRYVARPKIYNKVKTTDASGEQRFPCSWPGCDAVYRARSELKSHMWRHTGEKVFVCEWPGCDKRFPVKRNLARHRETHEGVKHYACDWPGCEYKSWYPQGVRAHRKRHTDERPHKCSWPHCEWTFRQSHHLKAHMLKHTGEKPFSCVWPGCDHRFQSRQAMRFHVDRAHK